MADETGLPCPVCGSRDTLVVMVDVRANTLVLRCQDCGETSRLPYRQSSLDPSAR